MGIPPSKAKVPNTLGDSGKMQNSGIKQKFTTQARQTTKKHQALAKFKKSGPATTHNQPGLGSKTASGKNTLFFNRLVFFGIFLIAYQLFMGKSPEEKADNGKTRLFYLVHTPGIPKQRYQFLQCKKTDFLQQSTIFIRVYKVLVSNF